MTGPVRRALTPLAPPDRVVGLDVLRGFALSGILLVNISTLSGYDFLSATRAASLPGSRFDHELEFLVRWLVHAKFYSLFALLFGIGFAIFMQRAETRGVAPAALFRRRLLGLLLIGLAHTLLVWFGDILSTYALLGFLLIPFWRAAPRTILRWSIALLLSPIVLHGAMVVVVTFIGAPGAGDGGAPPAFVVAAIKAFRNGRYADIVGANATITAVAFVGRRILQMQVLRILGMFLLGLYLVRREFLTPAPARDLALHRTLGWGAGIGLPLGAIGALLPSSALVPAPTAAAWAATACDTVSAAALSLAYAAGVTLLVTNRSGGSIQGALAAVGRLALTNYLFQSIACVVIFYGIGFGWFGRVSLGYSLAIAAGIVGVQLVLSSFWLRRFPQGPAERLWRRFTYGT